MPSRLHGKNASAALFRYQQRLAGTKVNDKCAPPAVFKHAVCEGQPNAFVSRRARLRLLVSYCASFRATPSTRAFTRRMLYVPFLTRRRKERKSQVPSGVTTGAAPPSGSFFTCMGLTSTSSYSTLFTTPMPRVFPSLNIIGVPGDRYSG